MTTTLIPLSSRPPMKRRGRGTWGLRLAPYLFLFPNMLIFGMFTIWPAINGFNMSTYASSNGRTFKPVGMDNYTTILSDAQFWAVARNTVIYAIAFVLISTVLGIALAVLIEKQKRFKVFFRSVFFIPVLISPVVVGLVWGWMLERQNGIVNIGLSWFGIGEVPWLVDNGWSMVSVIGVGVWMQVGFYMLILLAGLQAIDPTLYEAARMDGASPWTQFHSITLPLLQPSVVVVVVLATIHGFQSFDFIYTLTGGGPVGATTLIVQYIYENGFQSPIRYGIASAGGVLLFVVVFLITIVNWLISRKQEAV